MKTKVKMKMKMEMKMEMKIEMEMEIEKSNDGDGEKNKVEQELQQINDEPGYQIRRQSVGSCAIVKRMVRPAGQSRVTPPFIKRGAKD
ncbi:hypothetical protein TWF718_006955 [Orbilia javanica]|uniref:Uncharacterized protein n=1 Tax=Orbilia javanica TaxID=47235 RepID=A0AAN8RN87_9PEZI